MTDRTTARALARGMKDLKTLVQAQRTMSEYTAHREEIVGKWKALLRAFREAQAIDGAVSFIFDRLNELDKWVRANDTEMADLPPSQRQERWRMYVSGFPALFAKMDAVYRALMLQTNLPYIGRG